MKDIDILIDKLEEEERVKLLQDIKDFKCSINKEGISEGVRQLILEIANKMENLINEEFIND